MSRANVFPIYGNHDLLALVMMKKLSEEITKGTIKQVLDKETIEALNDWQKHGGTGTFTDFCNLNLSERLDIIDYLSDFSIYETVSVGENIFIPVHAGLGNFSKGKRLSEYSLEELVLDRNDPDIKYFDDDHIFIVTGHTPTQCITGKAEIYKSHNNICIDCGAFDPQGKLACLCLDTTEEFYV